MPLVTTITPISPFYDERSSAPPPCTPLLTDQQELWAKVPSSPGLLAEDVLSPSHLDTPTSRASSLAPEFRLASKSPIATRSILSPTRYTKKERVKSPQCGSDEDLAEISDVASTMTSLSDDEKISKPPGEPGRPGRGGYNVETALGWDARTYSKFKMHVHSLIDEYLDVSKCASSQSTTLLKIVQDKTTEKFPDLENYTRCWPVTDLIMMRLKYTSSRARKQETEMAAGKSRKLVKQ